MDTMEIMTMIIIITIIIMMINEGMENRWGLKPCTVLTFVVGCCVWCLFVFCCKRRRRRREICGTPAATKAMTKMMESQKEGNETVVEVKVDHAIVAKEE